MWRASSSSSTFQTKVFADNLDKCFVVYSKPKIQLQLMQLEILNCIFQRQAVFFDISQ